MNCRARNLFALPPDVQNRAKDCQNCIKHSHCPAYELSASRADATYTVQSRKTVQPDQTVFNAGEPFDGLYVVRSGFFKSFFIDTDGVMQVTGFHFPGEVFGMDGIETGFYGDTVQALDTGSICRIPLTHFIETTGRTDASRTEKGIPLNENGAQNPGRMLPLVRIMSKTIARDRQMIFALGKMCARRRFATFLLDVSSRMGASGYDRTNLRLCMSRTDIANYLCLALETISRLFTQLEAMGVIEVERRNVNILDMQALEALIRDEAAAVPLARAS